MRLTSEISAQTASGGAAILRSTVTLSLTSLTLTRAKSANVRGFERRNSEPVI